MPPPPQISHSPPLKRPTAWRHSCDVLESRLDFDSEHCISPRPIIAKQTRDLSGQDTGSTNGSDLLFSILREELGLHDDGLLGQDTLAEYLVVSLKRTTQRPLYPVQTTPFKCMYWEPHLPNDH